MEQYADLFVGLVWTFICILMGRTHREGLKTEGPSVPSLNRTAQAPQKSGPGSVALMYHLFRDGTCLFSSLRLSPLTQALLGDSGSQTWSTGTTDQYGRLDRELQLANSHFIEEQQAQQQVP